MSAYTIEVYDGSQHPALQPYERASATTEREARRIAARMLGHASLRGASSWESRHGGMAYQFGPRAEGSDYDYAVVYEVLS